MRNEDDEERTMCDTVCSESLGDQADESDAVMHTSFTVPIDTVPTCVCDNLRVAYALKFVVKALFRSDLVVSIPVKIVHGKDE